MNGTALLAAYCGVILLASVAGGWLPLVLRPTHIRLQTYLSFASGVMLGAAMCHMLPEAAQRAGDVWFFWTLAGLLGLFFLERFFAFHHHEMPQENGQDAHAATDHSHGTEQQTHEHCDHPHHSLGQSSLTWWAAVVGLSVHTLAGGFALAAAVAADEGRKPGVIGFGVFLATVLHKPADSLTITSLMISGGARRVIAHVVNLLFALAIPLGATMFYVVREFQSRLDLTPANFTGAALAFSAGTFLSIALGDLMPELQFHRHDRVKLSLALLAGVAVMVVAVLVE